MVNILARLDKPVRTGVILISIVRNTLVLIYFYSICYYVDQSHELKPLRQFGMHLFGLSFF